MIAQRIPNRPFYSQFCIGMSTIVIGLFSLVIITSVTSIEGVPCDNVGIQYGEASAVTSHPLIVSSDSGTIAGDNVEAAMFMDPTAVILPIASGLVTLLALLSFVGLTRVRTKTGSAITYDLECKENAPNPIMEKRSISERFLVICPFCGSKNEHVESICKDCGAEF